MYHCTLEDKPTSVISLDANTFILMVHVFASRLPDHDWILRIQKNHFLNASKIHDYIGNELQSRCQQCSPLLLFFSILLL